jgi:protein KRI1
MWGVQNLFLSSSYRALVYITSSYTIMAKRKAEIVGNFGISLHATSKKTKHASFGKSSLMHESDSSSDESEGGAKLDESAFKINEEYAKKFEHNKKREELQRCE